jgi:predicted metal-dependent phosphoesterase TrpH
VRIDLHVHTWPKSQCSKINPEDLIAEAKRIGLDGFCLTEHQCQWDPEEVSRLAGDSGIKVFRGNEITTAQGDVLVFEFYKNIQGIVTAEALCREVRETGGFSIAAHPFRGFKVFGFGQLDMSAERAAQKKILQFVDAVEIRNGRVTEGENDVAEKVAEQLGLIQTAGSDAHELDALGTWIMDFEAEFDSEADLVREIRAGKFMVGTLK